MLRDFCALIYAECQNQPHTEEEGSIYSMYTFIRLTVQILYMPNKHLGPTGHALSNQIKNASILYSPPPSLHTSLPPFLSFGLCLWAKSIVVWNRHFSTSRGSRPGEMVGGGAGMLD